MPALDKLKEEIKYEITGITLFALSVLIALSMINPSVGIVGRYINAALMHLAGEGKFIFPVLMALFGFKMIYRKSKVKMSVNLYGAVIVSFVMLTLLHFSVPQQYIIEGGMQGDGGGIIGAICYYALFKSFGVWGLYIVLAASFMVGLLLLTNKSILVICKLVYDKIMRVVKKTVCMVDDFLFLKEGVEKGQEEGMIVEEGPVIIDRCSSGEGLPEGLDDGYMRMDNEDQPQQPPGRTEKKRLSNIIYYHPAAQNKQSDNQEETRGNKPFAEYYGVAGAGNDWGNDGYKLPPVSLLSKPPRGKVSKNNRDITENIARLEETLGSFGIKAKVLQVSRGPAITRYEIQPPPGVKVSRIVGLADDIALSMAAPDVRIEAPVPGKAVVGIEVPNKEIGTVFLRELVETNEFQNLPSYLTIALGKDIAGNPILDDLARMPHLLIAGATGSGKSVCLNTLIAGILFKSSPEQVKFLIIDPKMVELTTFNGIPHLVSPVVTDPKKAATSLRWAVKEMEYRYELFAQSGVRDIARYNILMQRQAKKTLHLLVVIIDELADLMMVAPADVEDAICRLAQMARAAGIHLVVATQRPSVDIITGLIKANIPSRISFAVSSQIDSRTILDMGGAEKLLGQGDMLFCPVGAAKPIRVQGAFLSDGEVENLVKYWRVQDEPKYDESIAREISKPETEADYHDDLLALALKIFVETGHASISLLQRRLHIGYARAARIMDIMEQKGYVGGYEGSKPRAVLISQEEFTHHSFERSDSRAGND